MAAVPLDITNGTILNPKCDILFAPDVVLGAGEAMRRREFIALVGSVAAAWPFAARAQQSERRLRRIGVLMARAANDPEGQMKAAALQRGIEQLGWSPGRNIEIEYRWLAGDASRAEALAKELLDWRPDILVANSTPSLVASRKETRTIPIVFVAVADPVAPGALM